MRHNAVDHRRSSAGAAQAVADARPRHLHRQIPPADARDQPAARLRSDARSGARRDRDRDAARTRPVPRLAGKKLCLVSILRAGNGILDGLLDLVPAARVGHIGIYREPRTLQAIDIPETAGDLPERDVILVDPMLATGNSAVAAISRLVELRARSIKFVCLVAAPEGIEKLLGFFPHVPIMTAAIDRCLTTTAISCRVSATPETGCSGRNSRLFAVAAPAPGENPPGRRSRWRSHWPGPPRRRRHSGSNRPGSTPETACAIGCDRRARS